MCFSAMRRKIFTKKRHISTIFVGRTARCSAQLGVSQFFPASNLLRAPKIQNRDFPEYFRAFPLLFRLLDIQSDLQQMHILDIILSADFETAYRSCGKFEISIFPNSCGIFQLKNALKNQLKNHLTNLRKACKNHSTN